jgi:two-component sensor histidine kinase
MLSVADLIGYAFAIEAFYSVSWYSTMALHTAFLFCLVFLSFLFFRHRRGWLGILFGQGSGSEAARWMFPVIMTVPLLLCLGVSALAEAHVVPVPFLLCILATAIMALSSILVFQNAHAQNCSEASLREYNEELKTALEDKNLLLREVYHRVKNNLQMTVSLLHIGSLTVHDRTAHEMLQKTTGRIRAMGAVHRILVAAKSPSLVKAKDFLEELGDSVLAVHSVGTEHSITVSADDSELNTDAAVTLGIVINELVTNAFKHAFPEGHSGEVRIEYTCNGETGAILTIADNGSGGAGFESKKSTGWKLIRGLVNQLGGTIEYRSGIEPGESDVLLRGTKVTVTIPGQSLKRKQYEYI